MSHFDVFNGDADGICALHQLRLDSPVDSELITGVKRDIALLDRVDAHSGDEVTVLDISLDTNRTALERLLEGGANVLYVDHHYAGDIPPSPRLDALINTASDVCTALLVNGRLKGAHRAWAVVGAFGDNLHESAIRAAKPLGLAEPSLSQLQQLGTYINYNAYGVTPEDLYFHPAELVRRIRPYTDPLEFIEADKAFDQLREGYAHDMARARALQPDTETERAALYVLPDAAWARRVSGVFGNELAREHPQRAHALLTHRSQGGYVVSVRAPRQTGEGADQLCRRFPTGGGRKAAAGINALPDVEFETFSRAFREAFS